MYLCSLLIMLNIVLRSSTCGTPASLHHLRFSGNRCLRGYFVDGNTTMTEQTVTCLGIAGGWFPRDLYDCVRVEGGLCCRLVWQVCWARAGVSCEGRKKFVYPSLDLSVHIYLCMNVYLFVCLSIYWLFCRSISCKRKTDRQKGTIINKNRNPLSFMSLLLSSTTYLIMLISFSFILSFFLPNLLPSPTPLR